MLADPDLAPFFQPGTIAEAALTTRLGDARLTARIDRLIVTAERVLAVDLKSDARPPGPDAPPPGYVQQLALYAHALRPLYPGRRVEAALLWTAVPRLDCVSDAALDAALAHIQRP